MRWYINDVSLQGQFADPRTFENVLRELLKVRANIQSLRANLRATRTISERYVRDGITVRHVVSHLTDTELRRAVFGWLDRAGPFVEDDRYPERDDYFECLTLDVTNSGLGEAARRVKAGELASSFSFGGGAVDFGVSPLQVNHGLEENRLGVWDVTNYWLTNALRESALRELPDPFSWRTLVEGARQRYSRLTLPDYIYENAGLAREPFDAAIRDRAMELLRYLDEYMAGRAEDGAEGPGARSIIDNFFSGERALFTGESTTNQRRFAAELTFPDPEVPDRNIFAHWHGKISHRFFRLHFEWPVPAKASKLKIVYLGPKLTKS
jgi:hypothetical protein